MIRILGWILFGRLRRDVTRRRFWTTPLDREDLVAPRNAYRDLDEPYTPHDDGRHCPICGRPADPDAEVCWACGEVITPAKVATR